MTVVAVITQPLRAQHCAAFLRRLPPSASIRIVTPDEDAFSGLELPATVQFRRQATQASGNSQSNSESKLKQGVIRWARGGTTWGMRFDRAIRSTIWRLRAIERVISRRKFRRSQHRTLLASFTATAQLLTEMNQAEEISQLVVFDVFDLPPVLEFGNAHSIPVIVR